ncbi:uncharacterized protein L201_004870 [Kwoniella dendrophila CBS 6074]|uniref:Uncharacterized protein n=1 Tax=Kwoniella dendrophila CBS 6074 TaxID=1295534 RepID=A0AAX4JX24_9TREE
MTESLIIDSLPCDKVSRELMTFYPNQLEGKFMRPFLRCRKLHLTSKFMYELSNWLNLKWDTITSNRQKLKKDEKHPFVNFLLLSIPKLTEIMNDYPTYNDRQKEDFIAQRWGNEQVLRRCGISELSRKNKLEEEWNKFKWFNTSLSLIPLIPIYRKSSNVTIRNVHLSHLPYTRGQNVTVEFRSSQCEDEKEEVTIGRRSRQILAMLQPVDDPRLLNSLRDDLSWTFISAEVGENNEVEVVVKEQVTNVDISKLVFLP